MNAYAAIRRRGPRARLVQFFVAVSGLALLVGMTIHSARLMDDAFQILYAHNIALGNHNTELARRVNTNRIEADEARRQADSAQVRIDELEARVHQLEARRIKSYARRGP